MSYVNVLASFTNKKLEPMCFTWQNREYTVEKINFVHVAKEGISNLVHFSITTDSNDTYQLTFNTKDLYWTLKDQ